MCQFVEKDNILIEIWNQFIAGDETAFGELFEKTSDVLYRYGMKFISDEEVVKDCIQDLFIKIHTNRPLLTKSGNPTFYLLLSMKNMIRDAIAREQRITYVAPEELPFIAIYQPDEDVNGEEDEATKEKFEQVINLLNPRQKEAIYLRFQLDLSYEEISLLLGINYQSARNLIHRSILKIKKKMRLSGFLLLFLQSFG